MVDEGALTLKLVVDGGRVSDLELTSTRRTDFSTVLTGLPVEKALSLVPSLFSICASAQAVAGLEACEAAMGIEADEGNRALRRGLVSLEAIDNHAFQFFVEWPRVAGLPPEVAAFRRVRGACQELRAALVGHRPWARLGGIELDGHVSGEGLRAAVEALVPNPLEADEAALRRWSPFLGAAVAVGARELGQGSAPLVPLEGPEWFARRLTGAAFSAAPTVDGVPAESGSLTYVESLPAVSAVLTQGGRTVWARLMAQLVNAHRLVSVVEEALPRVAGGRTGGLPGARSGAGAGIADTSRGRLAHAVQLRDGVVTSWRTVAPTEWSFHPRGTLLQALMGIEAEGARVVSPFLIASLDPCVACKLAV